MVTYLYTFMKNLGRKFWLDSFRFQKEKKRCYAFYLNWFALVLKQTYFHFALIGSFDTILNSFVL